MRVGGDELDIVTAQEMYEWDRVAIEEAGVEGTMLMESAGRAVAEDMSRHIDRHDRVVVLIGSGNNGGDGFVIAKTLLNRGYDIETWQVVADEKITGDAAAHKGIFLASGFELQTFSQLDDLTVPLERADVIIDAMLGIGVSGGLRTPILEIVELANKQEAKRLSVDIPSGVPAGETTAEFAAFRADYTTIVAAPKVSAFLQQTRPFYGDWEVVEIGLPVAKLPSPGRMVWGKEDVRRTLPQREADAHKGSHGKGLMVGGSVLMPGSIAMSAKASLRSGAGLVAIATVEKAIASIAPYVQEATFVGLNDEGGFASGQMPDSLASYDGIAVGMGLGRKQETQALLRQILVSSESPLLIDADGLYLLKDIVEILKKRDSPTVLTPHPGEFAHLLGVSIADVLHHPFSFSREFASTYGVYLVLKGPDTIITAPDGEQRVDSSGNAGLAKGGSGDVLSGVLLTEMMQTESLLDAISNGCVLHGSTAEQLTKHDHTMTDLLATDVIEGLTQTFRAFS